MTVTARSACFFLAFVCFVITAVLVLAKSTFNPLFFVWVGTGLGFLGLAFDGGQVIGGPRRAA